MSQGSKPIFRADNLKLFAKKNYFKATIFDFRVQTVEKNKATLIRVPSFAKRTIFY